MDIEDIIAPHLAEAQRQVDRALAQREVRKTEITAESPDRTLKITQTFAGETLKVEIADGAFDKHDERSFAKLLTDMLKATHKAARDTAEKMTDQVIRERKADDGRRG